MHDLIVLGSHGAGTAYETETPFIAWGSGVNYWRNLNNQHSEYVILNICEIDSIFREKENNSIRLKSLFRSIFTSVIWFKRIKALIVVDLI